MKLDGLRYPGAETLKELFELEADPQTGNVTLTRIDNTKGFMGLLRSSDSVSVPRSTSALPYAGASLCCA